jgi:hypothetical protein
MFEAYKLSFEVIMKKIAIAVSALILALLIAGIFILKANRTNIEESMPDIEQVQGEHQENYSKINLDVPINAEDIKDEIPQSNIKTEKKIIFRVPLKKTRVKLPQAEKNTSDNPDTIESRNTNNVTRKYTPEEEELLKKIPRSDVVVVDKEIKLKSSGKYRFR